ncbi:MAG: FixH family protein [Ignavibacteria bacterium]|nr:FixH family protein [Ignavibacteria bacterium]
MNWGYKILTAFIIFCLTIIGFVIFFMNQKVDVVTDNYYEKELKYQDQLNRVNRTRALKDSLTMVNTGKEIKITFPNAPDKPSAKDFILLYRPSDNKMDVKIPVMTDSSRTQVVSIGRLDKGFWKLQINWTSSGSEYYYESAFVVK